MNIIKRKLYIIVVYKCVIDLLAFSLSEYYIYHIKDISINKLVLSWGICLLFWKFSFELVDILKYSFDFMLFISFIPTMTAWWFRNEPYDEMFVIVLFWSIWLGISIFFSHFKINKKEGDTVCRECRFWKHWMVVTTVIVILCTIRFCYIYSNFRLFVPLTEIYNIRDTVNMSSTDGYIFCIYSMTLLPMIGLYYCSQKKWGGILLSILLCFLNYSIMGQKIIIISMIVVFTISFIQKFSDDFYSIVCYLQIGIVFVIIINFLSNYKYYALLSLVDRLVYIPAEAHFFYLDFFKSNELLYFRQSFLRHFFENPYHDYVSIIIGSDIKYNYSGDYNNLSNGLISDAYANLGLSGIIVYPLVDVILLKVYSEVTSGFSNKIRIGMLIIFLYKLISASPFQLLVSGGLGLVILFFEMNNCVEKLKVKNGDF